MSERDGRLSARDAEMLDSLYRTAPAPSEGDAELEQLQELRSVFAELKAHQEEPPPAGMALLMAAARQAAQERPPVGLWARLRAGWSAMLAHPGMSAVAAAVVVIGVGGYLVSRGVQPASEQAPVVSSAAAPEASAGAAPAAAAPYQPTELRSPVAAPASTAPERPSGEASPLELDGAARGRAPVKRPAPARDASDEGTKKRAAAPKPKDEEAAVLGGVQQAPKLQEQWSAEPEAPVTTKAEPPAPKAPPPPKAAKPKDQPQVDASSPAASLEREKGAGGRGAASTPAEEATDDREELSSRARRWYELAKAAAAKGDCDAVKLLGARIKSEDPALYEARFRKDAAIAKCL